MVAELVHDSGEIDGGCLIYRRLHDTMFPGEALSPYLILFWVQDTESVIVELEILERFKRSGLFMLWPNPGDSVCQDLTQSLWTNQMVKTKCGDR